jgi:hypothetical protein
MNVLDRMLGKINKVSSTAAELPIERAEQAINVFINA